jgi:hypothetical protein
MTSAYFHGDSPIDVIGRREAWRLSLEATLLVTIFRNSSARKLFQAENQISGPHPSTSPLTDGRGGCQTIASRKNIS